MRLIYFHQYFSTLEGSTGTRSYEMAQSLIRRGHQVTMICGKSQMSNTGLSSEPVKGIRKGFVDGIEVIELDLPYSNYYNLFQRAWIFFLFAWRSIIIVLTFKYDLVFATSTPLTAGIPGIIAKIFRRKPFVFEVRDLWPEIPKEMGVITNPFILGGMSLLEWLCYHCADGCIGLSPGIVKGIMKRGISDKKVKLIPNACDLNIFNPEKGEVIKPSGIEDNATIVLFSGAHGIANGLNSVLDVASVLIKRSIKNIIFIFIGDGKTKPELIKRSEYEGLTNCLFINPVNKQILNGYLRGADLGLMVLSNYPAFYYGTSPNKFFDYISSGLPVINNYPGWIADMIKQYQCGVVIEPDKPEIFADILIKLSKEKDKISQMGLNARMLAEKEFNREKISNQFVDFIENIII